MNARIGLLAGAAMIGLLAGCAGFKEANKVNDTTVAEARAASVHMPQAVSVDATPYLLGSQVEIAAAPSPVLKMPVTLLNSRPVSIRELAGQITSMIGIPVEIGNMSSGAVVEGASSSSGSTGVGTAGGLPAPPASLLAGMAGSAVGGDDKSPSVQIAYHGDLGGLLDEIAARAGISWKFEDGKITLFKIETKTFPIAALPWMTTSSSSISSAASAASGSSSSSSGSGGTTAGGSTTISSNSTTDFWGGMVKTAQIVGAGAQVVGDASSGTLTVTGTPTQVGQIAEWVKSQNENLSKLVVVTIDIYDVQINNEQNYGFNPTVAFANAAKTWGLSVAGVPAPTVASGATPMTFAASILSSAQGTAGQFSGSSAAVQALSTLGHVTQKFTHSVTTLNGEPAPIQVGKQTGYLAESQTTATTNAGTTSSLMPGSITTGFTGTFTPRVIGNKIFLGMNITISSLVSLLTVSSGGDSIQVPTTTDSVVQQSAALTSGSTLMITGYNEDDGSSTQSGVGTPTFSLLGGGHDSQITHDMIAIVVTARVL